MKKYFYLIVFCFSCFEVGAQFLDNKLNLSFLYAQGEFGGEQVLEEAGFIYPSFYPNFNDLSAIGLKATYQHTEYFSFGLLWQHMRASQWQNIQYNDYNAAEAALINVSPIIQIHTPFQEQGFLNRFNFFLESGPLLGKSHIDLDKGVFEIKSIGGASIVPALEHTEYFYGFRACLGVNVRLHPKFGVFVQYSRHQQWLRSHVHADERFLARIISAGLSISLIKVKNIYY